MEQRTVTTKPVSAAAVGLQKRLWMVVRSNGERHLIHKEPIEGIAEWAKGSDSTVAEYQLAAVVHTPPPVKKKPA